MEHWGLAAPRSAEGQGVCRLLWPQTRAREELGRRPLSLLMPLGTQPPQPASSPCDWGVPLGPTKPHLICALHPMPRAPLPGKAEPPGRALAHSQRPNQEAGPGTLGNCSLLGALGERTPVCASPPVPTPTPPQQSGTVNSTFTSHTRPEGPAGTLPLLGFNRALPRQQRAELRAGVHR